VEERVIVGDAGGEGFRWTDVEGPTDDETRALYARFGLPAHLPVLLDEPRRPRPTLFEEEGFVFATLVGAAGDDLVPVRCFAGPDWLLTMHPRAVDRMEAMLHDVDSPSTALAALAKGLVTGIVEQVGRLDDEVQRMEQGLVEDPTPLRRRLGGVRQVVLTQRDVLVRLGSGGDDGLGPRDDPASRSLRNSGERLAQVGVQVESLREALHDASSDRQNDIVKRLTVIAAIFLPLTFVTGFFGQNFAWMVERVNGPVAFVALGIGLPVAMVAGLLFLLERSGWL
jgi:magnesium transporter